MSVIFSPHQKDIYLPLEMMPVKFKKKVGLFLVFINHDSQKELRLKVGRLTRVCGDMLGKDD